jgi:phage portal protein BeeE
MPSRSPGLIAASRAAQKRARQGAAAAIAAGSIGYGSGGPAWLDQFRSKRAPVDVELVEQYKAIAFACIQLNASAVAGVRCRVYCTTGPRDAPARRDVGPVPTRTLDYLRKAGHVRAAMKGATQVNEVLEHPFVEALDQPNPFFDGSMLLHYFAACLDCLGKFYFYPDRPDVSYAASQWWPLQPQYVIPQKGSGDVILQGYTYWSAPFAADEIEGGRFLSLRDPYLSGYAPLHACYEQLGLTNYYTAVVEGTLKGGARPSGILGPKDSTTPWLPEQRARVEEDVNLQFGGGRQGHIWVTDGSYTFSTLSYPPADLAGLEVNKNARLLAANCFSVPISLLQTEDSNRAVAEAGNYQHQKSAVRPRCVAIAAALTKMARRVDPRIFIAFDDPVEADETARQKIVDMKIKNGQWSINRALEEEGEPPVEWGAEPWFSSTLVQPSHAEERAQADADAKAAALAAAAEKPESEVDQPDPDEGPDTAADKEAERAMMHGMARLLARLEGRLDVPTNGPAGNGPRDGVRGARSPEPFVGDDYDEPIDRPDDPPAAAAAGGGPDPVAAPGVLPPADEGDPRDPPPG